MTVQDERAAFNLERAPQLAAQAGFTKQWTETGSDRFRHYVDDAGRLAIVAGPQEGSYVDLALAHGLGLREKRQLVLVLPEEHAFATLQRAPWFTSDAQPIVYLHDGRTVREQPLSTPGETVEHVKAKLRGADKPQGTPVSATTPGGPKHLGAGEGCVYDLVEWATANRQLDASHLDSERAWHCLGQKVLTIRGTKSAVVVRAGIHYSDPAKLPHEVTVSHGEELTVEQLQQVKAAVEVGMAQRLNGTDPLIHRPDEHWLQAVIRRDPSLVGVEQPALREVPAWRPQGGPAAPAWGRGFVDLLGLDGHGNIRIVETKLAANEDDMLVLQGLDYYIWAKANETTIKQRLAAATGARLETHYVIGDTVGATEAGKIRLSKHTHAQALSLGPEVAWRFQTVRRWFGPDAAPQPELFDVGEVPAPDL